VAEAVGPLREMMKHAGFTQVAFITTLSRRPDLVAEVLASESPEGMPRSQKGHGGPFDESTMTLRRYIKWYLSQAHRDDSTTDAPSPDLLAMNIAWGRVSTVALRTAR